MRVGIVTPVYPPYRGGMGAVAARDAQGLRDRGVEVRVYTPDYPGREKNPDATYVKPALSFGNAALVPGLPRVLAGVDLAHLHYPFYGADMFVWLWSLLWRKPYVLTYHMQPHTDDWRNSIFTLHRIFCEPFMLGRAKAVLVSSLDYAKSIGLRHRNLMEMPFSVDEQRFSPGDRMATRSMFHLPEASTVFVFVGGLDKAHSFKGVDVLIRAAANLPLEDDWRVLVVGDGDMRPAYEMLAKTLGIGDRFIFAGSVSDEDLPNVYRAADVHVLPSTGKSEAFGLVTLEAAATGLPSIVSDLPGVRTLVLPGESGLVVEPGIEESLEGAMRRLLDTPELTKAMGQRARKMVLERYAQSMLADRLLEVYNEIV